MNEQTQETIEKVQVHIDQAKEAVKMLDDLNQLVKIPEFKSIILEGFMKDEPARLASVITDPSLLDDENQREMLGALKAVGYLGDYLRNIDRRGQQMKAAIAQNEEFLSDLRKPEAE